MAQTIKLKRSASSGAVPSTSSLELGEVAINTYDGKMYIKKNDGSDSVVEVGGTATQQTAIWQPYAYTATSNQTTFTGSDDNSRTMKYIVGYLEVYVNGLLLDPSTDYTATNGVSIVLATAASASDLVQINTFVKVVGTGDITLDTFTGNGSTVAYTLSVSPGSENNTQVYVNAVYQNKDTYTVSGTTLTFDTAPVNNAEIEVTAGSRNVSFTDVNDLTISGDLVLADTKKLKLGDSNDLEIYHDTSNSIIRDNGAGHIQILSGTVTVGNAALSKTSALFSSGGAQTLYYDNDPKFVTSSAGIGITGNIAVSGTVDGVDIAARDAILTSTTTTAGAALPKAGGTLTGNLSMGDNVRARFGDSNDLQLWHTGTASIIDGGDSLRLRATNDVKIQNDNSTAIMAIFTPGGSAELRFDNDAKLATTNTGIDVTGVITTDGMTTSADVNFGDNDKAVFGAGSDLQIYHNAGTSFITESGSSNLKIGGENLYLQNTAHNENYLAAIANQGVTLYYNNVAKLATTSTGIDVTGSVGVTNIVTNKVVKFNGTILDDSNITDTGSLITLGSNTTASANLSIGGATATTAILSIPGADTTTKPQIRFISGLGTSLADAAISTTDDSGGTSVLIGSNLYYSNAAIARFDTSRSGSAIDFGYTGNMKFYTGTGSAAPTEKMRIAADGGVNWSGSHSSFVGELRATDTSNAMINAVNELAFYTNNAAVRAMHIDSTGKVGIGTASPDALLHVSATSPHIDIGPQGGNRGKIGYHSNDVIIGSTSGTGNIIFKNNISSTGAPQTDGDVKMTIADVGLTIHSDTYNILNLQTDSNNDQTSTDGIIKITNNNGSIDVTKAEFRWDESEDLVHVSYGDHGRHVSINSSGNVGINTGSTSPTATLDVAGTALVENAKLKAIAESNTDTAVDVFVYDTRKDSDGGAWRKRTQNTSWYNETLNTATRGSRKEFPSVAVIVAEAYQLTIYDGDDPDMPMWMVFNGQAAGGYLGYGIGAGRSLSSVVALNGAIHTGGLVGNWATDINFITERGYFWGEGNSGYTHTAIVNRNTASSINEVSSSIELVHGIINDIAVTVLPNAPIDADTGLPVPTIAVATNAGVSVIKDDGTVVDITNGQDSSAFNYIDNLFFRKDGALVWVGDSSTNTAAERFLHVLHNLPNADINQGTVENSSVIDEQYGPSHKTGSKLRWATTAGVAATSDAGENFAAGTSGALHLIKYNREVEQEGSIAHITSDYNTGYMLGDIKLATLSDTDTTNAVGTELITNGTFDSNITGWSDVYLSNISWDAGGYLHVNNPYGTAARTGASQALTNLTVGKTYTVSALLVNNSGISRIALGTSYSAETAQGYTGVISHTFVATSTNHSVRVDVYRPGYGCSIDVDNISVRLAEPDRSYNNNGLQVFGTVTKTAVATGADLVGYNASNTASYLEQPYNSELDFGTAGDFHYSFWVYSDSTATYNGTTYIFERTSVGDPSSRRIEARLDTSTNLQVYATSAVFVTGSTAITVPTDSWIKVDIIRKSNVGSVWINGVQKVSGSHSGNMTDTSAKLTVCNRGYFNPHNQGFPTGIALFRVSATAPSEEQIKKMYNDEKFLFQENAKATLYGSSDAVTALAYDDDTELLHVGTSAGRSVFQGLNRVDNTTDAVGAAISASNGLVAED